MRALFVFVRFLGYCVATISNFRSSGLCKEVFCLVLILIGY